MTSLPPALDHLVYATPWLDQTVRDLAGLFGVNPLPGGSHPAWGTRNAIVPLSAVTYLEIIGPDSAGTGARRPAIFGLDTLSAPRLATWAAKATQLGSLVARALTHGIELGLPAPGRRQRPDGTTLQWELTDPTRVIERGLVPFFIDWGSSPHPGASGPAAITLTELRAVHPDPASLQARLRALKLELAVVRGPQAGLVATFHTPHGPVTLR